MIKGADRAAPRAQCSGGCRSQQARADWVGRVDARTPVRRRSPGRAIADSTRSPRKLHRAHRIMSHLSRTNALTVSRLTPIKRHRRGRRWRVEDLHVGIQIGGLAAHGNSIAFGGAELHTRDSHLSKEVTVGSEALLPLFQIGDFCGNQNSRPVFSLVIQRPTRRCQTVFILATSTTSASARCIWL